MSFGLTFAGCTGVFEVVGDSMCPAVADGFAVKEGLAYSWWVWWACALNSIAVGPVCVLVGSVGC